MLELIISGPEPAQQQRREIPEGEVVRLGRSPRSGWAIPWDLLISREHCELTQKGSQIYVQRLESARNPVYLEEVDTRIEEKAVQIKADVKDKCQERFDDIKSILGEWKIIHDLALKENTSISKAAVEASIANGHAIQAIADSLSGTIATESGIKKGGRIIGLLFMAFQWIGAKLWVLGDWLLKAFKGAIIIGVIIGLISGIASGRLSWHEVTKYFEKIIGG